MILTSNLLCFTNEDANGIVCVLTVLALELGWCLLVLDSASFYVGSGPYCAGTGEGFLCYSWPSLWSFRDVTHQG